MMLRTLAGLILAAGSVIQTPTARAAGTFEVTVKPVADDHLDGGALARMTLDKVYHGDLEATAVGQMLTGMSPTEKTSGVYVAVERVTGALEGRRGTFMLHHTGVMDRGAQKLTITVVPDSGTGELTGLSGTLAIDIRDGKHFYTFDYRIPPR